MTPGPGHNKGPTLEPGTSFRRYVWTKARRDLVKTVPLEILRRRIARAAELGLDYKTYASIRASTGHDVIGFLFSGNALRLRAAQIAPDRAAKLAALQDARKIALIYPPNTPDSIQQSNMVIDAAFRAPRFTDSWSVMRDRVAKAIHRQHIPSDTIVVIGDTTLEREWADAGKTAGYLSSDRYFGMQP